MDCKKIGKYIKDKRKALGYKQSDLGEMLSVSDKAVSKWECGVALPDVSLLPELSKILNVDISEILNGEDDPKVEEEIKNKNKSKICIITLSILSSLLFILVIILGIYFINNYDRVHVYKLIGEKDDFRVEGKLISIGDDNYILLNDFVYTNDKDDFLFVDEVIYDVYYKNELLYSKNDYNDVDIYNYFDYKNISFVFSEKNYFSTNSFFDVNITIVKKGEFKNVISIKTKIIE